MKMANTTLFQSIKNRLTKTDTHNEAGGIAYTLTPKQQLAQLAATGCLNNTYYADAQSQLDQVLKLAESLDAEFIAKTAVYARQKRFYERYACAVACRVGAKRCEHARPRIRPSSGQR